MSVAETKKTRGVKKSLPLEKKQKAILLEKPKKIVKKKLVFKKIQPSKSTIAKVKKSPRLNKEKPQEVVFLPSPASIRLAEKVELYKLWYENYLSIVMDKTARVGGYLFILLGATLATSSYLMENNFSIQSAAVVCSNDSCQTVVDENLPTEAPRVQFLNSLPSVVDSDLDISLQLSNASNFEFKIVDSASGVSTTLKPYEVLENNQFTFIIPTETLRPSSYAILIEVHDSEISYLFDGPTFIIPRSATTVEPTDKPNLIPTKQDTSSANDATSTATTTEDTTSKATTTDDVVLIPENTQDIYQTPISLKLEQTVDSSYLQIKTGNYMPSKVEVYAQLENFPQPIFLGLATQVQSDWIFSVSALDLPHLKHYIFASFKDNNTEYQSGGVIYTPYGNESQEEKLDVELALLVQKVDLSLTSLDPVNINRSSYFSNLYNAEQAPFSSLSDSENQLLTTPILDIIDRDLTDDQLVLDSLFQFYASAVSGGNSYLVEVASRELQAHYEDLSTSISNRLNEPSLVTTLNTVLSHRYQLLMSKITANEESIKQASNGLSATDSDGDGLSDYDELAVYKTSPTEVDSDNNAVVDAIEIVNSLNILTNISEDIQADNYLNAAITNNDLVSIKSVGSVINVNPSGEQAAYALIQGNSLPNSYVFISLVNSPIIGIIKTNENGEFSYTLENELADADYSIIASLFDGNGQAIVSSQPYNFTKKTNEFIAAGIASQQSTFSDNLDINNNLPYYVTASVGVMAFGLILLMLSLSLRSRQEMAVKFPSGN